MIERITITIVGSGYVGLVAAACLAELGHQIVCVDNDRERVDALRNGNAQFMRSSSQNCSSGIEARLWSSVPI